MIKNNKNLNSCFKAGGVLFCVLAAFFFAVFGATFAQAQTAMVTEVSAQYPTDAVIDFHNNSQYMCTDWNETSGPYTYNTGTVPGFPTPTAGNQYNLPPEVDFVNYWGSNTGTSLGSMFYNAYSGTQSADPWRNSALIEFDQPYMRGRSSGTLWCNGSDCNYIGGPTDPSSGHAVGTGSFAYYPNHCLHLCAEVTCANPARKTEGSSSSGNSINTYYEVQSSDFPIQSVLFEVFKYRPGSNPYNAESTPPIRTIALTPQNGNTCKGVPVCQRLRNGTLYTRSCCGCTAGNCQLDDGSTGGYNCWTNDQCAQYGDNGGFSTKEECEAGTTKLKFCAGWDGSYEIDGEFGKSNGQFGFRAHIQTKWPGDGISSGGDVEIDHTMAYPGVASDWPDKYASQIPIQVDVTNVHSVRSSSTMVGTTTKVPAQPYNLTYKLSKDATTTIRLMDPGVACKNLPATDTTTFQTITSGSYDNIDFNIIDGQPRIGEGIPDGKMTNTDFWDGRDDRGNFLPHGNYLVSIQASTYDEWTELGKPDISRTTTRQLSLDPLKITDIKETGLAKFSTSYAKIDYVITEPSTVHVMIFTPGTYFNSVDMPTWQDPETEILARIANNSGRLVDNIVEQKQSRVVVNTKWDGICRNTDTDGCNFNGGIYKNGTPMPDGDYVYVMWAEIPYSLTQDATLQNVICINGEWWAGVRTYKYHNGILPINRGLPEITLGAVGYTTIGSSPVAYGLDPFNFNFSVSRDAIVDATIKTTANAGETPLEVKKLLTNEVAVANKLNAFTWDGIDEYGYQVAPGTYMVEFIAKDSLYPEKQTKITEQFPIDMFRVVDVETKSLLDDVTGQASISYTLSKSMDVVVEIYDQGVTIPTDDEHWCKYSTTPASTTTAVLIPPVPGAVPIKSFTLPKAGEGMTITEIWDGLVQSTQTTGVDSGVKPVADGNYPYRICTRTIQNVSKYYDYTTANPVALAQVDSSEKIGATDKPTGFITVARGSIAFNKVLITPSQPTLKYSSETVYLPSYEIGFSTSRSASVNIDVISTAAGQCTDPLTADDSAGTICRTLSTYAYNGVDGYFDPTKIYKVYWDGKDSKGNYVKYGSYEIKLTGLPYPLPDPTPNPMTGAVEGVGAGMPLPTIYTQVISVNNFQVYDRYVEDITNDNPHAKFAYQISVPMKVAIQIFKPGTTTNRNSTTATGLVDPMFPNQDLPNANINDVLVKSIVGIRPNLVSIDEVWDGTDYAGQEVPDGIYPYRYVTVFNAYDMDSVTGALNVNTDNLQTAGGMVADWEKYITLEHINVARGDSWYADLDWKSNKVTSFFPNPLRGQEGWFEITKLPAPGKVSIKIYNIAGDLVRDKNYDCINAKGETATLDQINNGFFGNDFGLQPYMNLTPGTPTSGISRNFTLRCKWDKQNNHGKDVARGLYYAIMELSPTRGNAKKSQRVIKILIP